MNISFRHRLPYKQARNTILVAFLLGIVLTALQIGWDLHEERARTEATVSQILNMSHDPASEAAYRLDGHLAQKVVDGLFEFEAVREARLVDDFGTTLAAHLRKESEKPLWVPQTILGRDLEYSIFLYYGRIQAPVGRLEISLDRYLIAKNFLDRAGLILIGGTIRDISLAFVLTVIFWYWITNPLLRMSERVADIDPASPSGNRLEIPAGHELDEMGQLAQSFNVLLEGFRQALARSQAAEKEILEREDSYRNLFDSINDFVYTHDLDGRIMTINPMAAGRLGLTPEEIIGRPISDFIPQRVRREFVAEYLPRLRDQDRSDGIMILTAGDGSELFLEYRNQPVKVDGQTAYVSGVGRDVTERFNARREIKKIHGQLLQSQKMEAVGTLASGIAHDFNNLLQAISGYIQLLEQDPGKVDSRPEYLARINEAVDRAAGLVKQLLTFSRKVKPELKNVDINHAVRETLAILERTIPRMVEIETSLAGDLKAVSGDPNQLEQVILNLTTNARDAMSQGGRLFIETENVVLDEEFCQTALGLTPGEYIRLRVSDNGQGINPEALPHIFEPFYTTKGVGRGTGLGLSTAYGIVAGHGGHITCESLPGHGAVFDVYLPALKSPGAVEDHPANIPQQVVGGPETILVVDDEAALVEVARELLLDQGYTVLTAATGEQALDLFRQGASQVDLVLLDLGMPGMGGLRCLEEMLQTVPDLKVIVASGYQQEDQGAASLEAGARAFMAKPYRLTGLLEKIRQVLDGP